jgi:N-acetylneuraminate synthase
MEGKRKVPKLNNGRRLIGDDEPTYFIADISANHDGSIERAKLLIRLASESGADAAKFQNFQAPKIVSDYGFNHMGDQLSHQAAWKKSVYRVYQEASLAWEWTPELKKECDLCGIDYLSTPYDFGAVDMLDPFVSMFKIGSGDITWPEMLEKVACKDKPVILATGASDIGDVQRAVNAIQAVNPQLALMQCNTNYTASAENFRHIHLNVLKTFATIFPGAVLGLSDHTSGHSTVLGAIALGARIIEKHFTDDIEREGPDHAFSMTPSTWREMVDRSRELEYALGRTAKEVAQNEKDTVVVQRRCLRAARPITAGSVIARDMLDVLRPAPPDAIFPYELPRVVGMRIKESVTAGEHLRWTMLEPAQTAVGTPR